MDIMDWISSVGADNIGITTVDKIVFEPEFRKACESNACGKLGKYWTCPPHVGDIHDLISKAKSYETAIVYQTIHDIEDSYDIEGMLESGDEHRVVSQKVHRHLLDTIDNDKFLHLGSGGCDLCKTCTITIGKPCVHPTLSMASLEAYGIAVSDLAKKTNLKYINGENTVTYFSVILLK
ncbi:MAG: DUF2284 domain-containing protein [Clostridia bacterium]